METHFPHMNQTRTAGERILEDLKRLVADAESLLHATAGDLGEKAKEARARLLVALERAKSSCEGLQTRSWQTSRAVLRTADNAIRRRPYVALAIALGAGVLVCCARTRRSSSLPAIR